LSIQTDLIDTSPALSVYNGSSTPLFYLLNNGNFGIATDTPTNILTIGQGMGNAIADGWSVYSSKEYKTDITYLEEDDYEEILDEIEGMNLARYRWKNDDVIFEENYGMGSLSTTDGLNLGVIAEEAPEEVLSNDGKSISLYDYTSFALAGVKALKKEVDELRTVLEANGYLRDSSTLPQDDGGMMIAGDNGEQFQLAVDEDGYVVLDKLKVKDLEIAQGGQITLPQGEDEIMGEGRVATSSDYAIIENNKVRQNSKIFVSFTSNLQGASWWICDKIEGESFKVCLSQPAKEALSFDYWIAQGRVLRQVEDSNSAGSVGVPSLVGDGIQQTGEFGEDSGEDSEEAVLSTASSGEGSEISTANGVEGYLDSENPDTEESSGDATEEESGSSNLLENSPQQVEVSGTEENEEPIIEEASTEGDVTEEESIIEQPTTEETSVIEELPVEESVTVIIEEESIE
jgi:hypothetical protein